MWSTDITDIRLLTGREDDARRHYLALGKRLERYGLTLAVDKTRLLCFSRQDRQGSGRFDFLGFEFSWGKSRYGAPQLRRRTSRKKYRASLAALQAWALAQVRKLDKPAFFARLNARLRGYYRYYAVRGNYESLSDFRYQRLWVSCFGCSTVAASGAATPGRGSRRCSTIIGWSGPGSSMTSERVECQARNTEEPGAGNPHAGICEGAAG